MSTEALSSKGRTLDYSIPSHVMDRIKAAGRAQMPDKNALTAGDIVGNVASQFSAVASDIAAAKDFKEKRDADSVQSFDAAMASLSSREGPYNTKTFEQAQAFETNKREEFMNADSKRQQVMLKEMAARSTSLQSMKSIIETVSGAYNNEEGNQFDMEVLSKTEGGRVMLDKVKAVMAQESTILQYNQNNEAYFEIGGEEVYARDLTQFITDGAKPDAIESSFAKTFAEVQIVAQDIAAWDGSSEDTPFAIEEKKKQVNNVRKITEKSISESNISSMMHNTTVFNNTDGKSFADILLESDGLFGLKDIVIPVSQELVDLAATSNNGQGIPAFEDGIITPAEFASFDILTDVGKANRQVVVDALEEEGNFELLKQLMIGYNVANAETTFDNNRAQGKGKSKLGENVMRNGGLDNLGVVTL
jgi:hypothetical protein